MNNIELTRVDMQVPRSAAEFFLWVNNQIRAITSTHEGKSSVRFWSGLCKILVEELLPLGLLCECFFKRDPRVTITPVLGNQNYDARVSDQRPNSVTFSKIEVTQAHEGENEYLRMLHLERHGHSSLLGTVSKSGTKRTAISVSVKSEAKPHSKVVNNQLNLIWLAMVRKLKKKYEPDTGLLVVFDDSIAIQDELDREKIRNLLRKNRSALMARFHWIGVIGWSGRTFESLISSTNC